MKLFAFIFFGWIGILTLTQAASFDCGKATSKVEKLICANSKLSNLDDELANSYRATITASVGDEKDLQKKQRYWLLIRNACATVKCIEQAYQTRLNDLHSLADSKSGNSTLVNGEPEAEIEDIAAKLHIISVGDMYFDGKTNLLCVEVEKNKYSLWNPLNNFLSPLSNRKNCEIGPGFHWFSYELGNNNGNKIRFGAAYQYMREPTFAGAVNVEFINSGDANCAINIKDYVSIRYVNGNVEDYYVIMRLKEARNYKTDSYCEVATENEQEVSQNFDITFPLSSVQLNDSETLFYSQDSNTIQPLLLKIKSLPKKSVWASHGNVFIIPKSILDHKLNDAVELRMRYDVLLRVTGNH
jgi:uncharacterized protein